MANTAVKAVLWDFGGVLTTSPFDSFAAYESKHDLPAGSIRRLNSTNPDDNAWARFERSQVTVDEFVVLFEKEASEAGLSLDARALLSTLSGELRPAMVDALIRSHERLKTGLLTNNFTFGNSTFGNSTPNGGSAFADRYAPVMHLFDVVVQSSTAGFRKPDPRFYATACEMLDIEPHEAVFLDDLGINLKPARQMGMITIKVIDPEQAVGELEEVVGFPLRGR